MELYRNIALNSKSSGENIEPVKEDYGEGLNQVRPAPK